MNETTPEARALGAVWGQLVGDAFCLGTHWIYDLDELHHAHPHGVQGFEAPAEGHYHFGKHPGEQTHYGDAALLLLRSIAETGSFAPRAFGARFIQAMGSPTYAGYRDHSTKGTLENAEAFFRQHPGEEFDFQQGADDDQLATVTRLAPLVVCYRHAPRAELVARIGQLTRVTQNNSLAVAYAQAAGSILASLLSGADGSRAVAALEHDLELLPAPQRDEVRQSVRRAVAAQDRDVVSATLDFGQSCPLPKSFPSALHAFLKYENSFAAALIANASAGGDNAGRAGFLGAWLGARLGFDAIPAPWRERLVARHDIASWLGRLVP